VVVIVFEELVNGAAFEPAISFNSESKGFEFGILEFIEANSAEFAATHSDIAKTAQGIAIINVGDEPRASRAAKEFQDYIAGFACFPCLFEVLFELSHNFSGDEFHNDPFLMIMGIY